MKMLINLVRLLEAIIYVMITVIVWIINLTLLLPVLLSLKYWTDLRKLFFSYFYLIFNSECAPNTSGKLRKYLFNLLTMTNAKPKLLEIGPAQGFNFQYYPKNSEITLLDANKHFNKSLQKTLKKYPNLNIQGTVIASVEDMKIFKNSEFDIVVCTYLFCSVKDANSAISEISRVLKEGGQLLYMDHIGYPKYTIGYWIQTALTPLWSIYTGDCALNKDHTKTLEIIDNYFSQNSYEVTYPFIFPLFIRPHIVGRAKK